jgi:hypothetical protein
MKNPLLPIAFAIALPTVFVLAGCDPTSVAPAPAASSPAADPSAEPEDDGGSTDPLVLNPDTYLVEHSPAGDDSNEYWHWAFWTDESKAVRCDISSGGNADPLTTCWVMPGFEASTSYSLPAGTPPTNCAGGGAAPQLDGYAVQLSPANPGFTDATILGCLSDRHLEAGIGIVTQILPNHGVLNMTDFNCSVTDAVATCTYIASGATVSLGLSAIGVSNP